MSWASPLRLRRLWELGTAVKYLEDSTTKKLAIYALQILDIMAQTFHQKKFAFTLDKMDLAESVVAELQFIVTFVQRLENYHLAQLVED